MKEVSKKLNSNCEASKFNTFKLGLRFSRECIVKAFLPSIPFDSNTNFALFVGAIKAVQYPLSANMSYNMLAIILLEVPADPVKQMQCSSLVIKEVKSDNAFL